MAAPHGFDSLFSVPGYLNLHAELLQNAHRHLLVCRIILDEQNTYFRIAGFQMLSDGMTRRKRRVLGFAPVPFLKGRNNDFQKLSATHRFRQVCGVSGVRESSRVASHSQGGEHDHAGFRKQRVRFDPPAERLSVHKGHVHVYDGDVERISCFRFPLRSRRSASAPFAALEERIPRAAMYAPRISRFVALSSTIRIRISCSSAGELTVLCVAVDFLR